MTTAVVCQYVIQRLLGTTKLPFPELLEDGSHAAEEVILTSMYKMD
jgi:hypothetical protein